MPKSTPFFSTATCVLALLAWPEAVEAEKAKVFFIMGQSNCIGRGQVGSFGAGVEKTLANAIENKGKYQYLVQDKAGGGVEWKTSATMRNVRMDGNGVNDGVNPRSNKWLSADNEGTIGPDIGIGHMLGEYLGDSPVLILKTCRGNRALGWDLLPPGTPQTEWTDPQTGKIWVYAGSGDKFDRWEKGTTPAEVDWYAGLQYDGDVWRADQVLADFPSIFPGKENDDFEVSGFFWWQGDRDSRDEGHSDMYERNLINLVNRLRDHYEAPLAPFVTASLGQSTLDDSCTGPCGKKILQAMLNVASKEDFNAAAVQTHSLAQGGSSGAHYDDNAEVYMDVGLAMGEAMVELLKNPGGGDAGAMAVPIASVALSLLTILSIALM